MTPLRRSSRTPKPVNKWIPPPSKRIKVSTVVINSPPPSSPLNEGDQDVPPKNPLQVQTIPEQGQGKLATLPTEILQRILSLACTHPNKLIRMMRVSSSFNHAVMCHPLWRQLLFNWRIPFKEPVQLNRDYHKAWRHAVIKRAKALCERCDSGTPDQEKPNRLNLGRHISEEYRQRLCAKCFLIEFNAFKNRAGNLAEYQKRVGQGTINQKESVKY
ncbi:hypothetical protein HDU99_008766, partial [Rhizoclosmatium hyalinum]